MKEEDLRRNHTREFKLRCCRQVATANKRPAQICREHNLSQSVLLRRRKEEYEARGEAAFTEKQPSQTQAQEARDEGDRLLGQAYAAVQQRDRRVTAVGHGNDLALGVPASDQEEHLPRPVVGELLVPFLPLSSV